MAFVHTIDATDPLDTAQAKLGAGELRDLKAAIVERLNSFFADANTDPFSGKSGAAMQDTSFTHATTPVAITNSAAAGVNVFIQLTRGVARAGYIGADVSDNLVLYRGADGAAALTVDRTTGLVTVPAAGAYAWTGRSRVSSPSDGTIQFLNAAQTSFSTVFLGGTSASFPALRRNNAELDIITADGLSWTPLNAGSFVAHIGNITGLRIIGGTDIASAVAFGVFSDATSVPANNAYTSANVLSLLVANTSTLASGAHVTSEIYHKHTVATSGSEISSFSYMDAAHVTGTSVILLANVASVEASGNGGTTTALGAYRTQAVIGTGHTVTSLALIDIRSPANSGTITTLIGLDIQAMTAGATNYAIRTSSGIVQLGPALTSTVGDTLRVRADSAATSTVQAARVELHMTASATGSKYGLEVSAYADHISGAIASMQGIRATLQATGNGGTTTSASVLSANASVSTGAIVSALSMILVIAPSGAGTITTLKGLDIGNMGAAQFAITTGTGIVQFGDILITAPSTVATAGFRLPSGTAPTSPTDGDFWYDGSAIKFRIGASTKTFVAT